MLRTLALATLSAVVFGQRSSLVQWGLQYDGTCEFTNKAQTQTFCSGKALSAEYNAFIDSETGVDWSIAEEKMGPASYLSYTEVWTASPHEGGELLLADGVISFRSTNGESESTLEFFTDGEDCEEHSDPEDPNKFLVVGYMNITGGTNIYQDADGWASFNRKDNHDSTEADVDFSNFIFVNFVDDQ